MGQLNFDTYLAEMERDRAITAAGEAADEAWRNAALQAVGEIARSVPEFTTDDVFERLSRLPVRTHEARAMGAVMRLAARLGWCSVTERFVKSDRVSRHRAPIQVWQSHLYGTVQG